MAQQQPRRDKRSSYFPIKLPVNTLSGGVGRQAPSKRLPTEAEELTNMFCTTERSIDKRSGFSPLSNETFSILGIDDYENKDLWYYWFEISEDVNYLIIIDYKATSIDSQLMWVFSISRDDFVVQAVETGEDINQDCRAYITYNDGSDKKAKDVLRAVSVGSTVLVLNTLVKAGFTSDGVERDVDGELGYPLHNLDGTISDTLDIKGKPVTYKTTIPVDPQGIAEYWSVARDYTWGEEAIAPTSNYNIYKVRATLGSNSLPGPTVNHTDGDDEPASTGAGSTLWEPSDPFRTAVFIPVEEYIYPDPDKLYIGQAVAKFSDLRFPPNGNNTLDTTNLGDSFLFNGSEDMLRSLYPLDGPTVDGYRGRGKIFYLSQAYLASSPGWYRVIDEVNKPYLKKVRTPDKMSLLDNRRMPMQVFVSTIPSDNLPSGGWRVRKVGWDPRTSGTSANNPGPSSFVDENGNAVQKSLKAISFYRDRLFLSTDDTLFSSRLGDFDNFFIEDPATITFRDPIDLRVSSNKYTPITWLIPYRDFLFLATSGETQYELMGSENQISPLSAEIAPTSFYPMASSIQPMLLNNNLFFYAHNRLYIYFGSTTDSPQQAFEVSRPAPNYLPRSFWDVTSSSSHNTLFVVGGETDEPSNNIFCFRNVISQDQILQNAFFKHETSTGPIQSINSMGDYLFIVTTETINNSTQLTLQKMYLYPDDTSIPRLDKYQQVIIEAEFDSSVLKTKIHINNGLDTWDQGVITSGSRIGEIVDLMYVETTNQGVAVYETEGDWSSNDRMWVGSKFTAKAKLSPIFVRDEGNNVIPGSLNLRYGVFRHFNTGMYSINVTRKNREPVVYSFNPRTLGDIDTEFGTPILEENGIFKFSILGFSDDIDIEIVSDFPHAMNITNMEFTGKFKRLPHFLTA